VDSASSASGPRLVLTGERLRGRHLVKLDGQAIWLPGGLFIALCELVRGRFSTQTGFVVQSSLTIHRLRAALDGHAAQLDGTSLVETGDGQEYRLALDPELLSVEPTFGELPSPTFISEASKLDLLGARSRAERMLKSV